MTAATGGTSCIVRGCGLASWWSVVDEKSPDGRGRWTRHTDHVLHTTQLSPRSLHRPPLHHSTKEHLRHRGGWDLERTSSGVSHTSITRHPLHHTDELTKSFPPRTHAYLCDRHSKLPEELTFSVGTSSSYLTQ